MNITRRSFIKNLATGLLVAAAPGVLLPQRKQWFVPRNAPVGSRVSWADDEVLLDMDRCIQRALLDMDHCIQRAMGTLGESYLAHAARRAYGSGQPIQWSSYDDREWVIWNQGNANIHVAYGSRTHEIAPGETVRVAVAERPAIPVR